MLFILAPILILILVPGVMVGIRLARPRFAYFWLVAAAGVLVAWPLVLLARPSQSLAIQLAAWEPQELFPVSPALLIDSISWPYALALATLVLAVILTEVARAPEADWLAWAGSMLIAGLGILAVLSGNLLTLLLAWTTIDVFELGILLSQVLNTHRRERVVVAFSTRVAGIALVIWAGVLGQSTGTGLTFNAISPQISLYLLLAAGLRLGVLPLHLPFLQDVPQRRSLGTILRLTPVAASLLLLTRSAVAGVPANLAPWLLSFTGLAALFGGVTWVAARDELDGRPFWILGMASLAFAAALRGQAQASLAWGISLLLSGGLLFLISSRHRYLLVLAFLGCMGMSALPFTPAWQGVRLYAAPFNPSLILLLLAQAALLAGYIRHTLQPGHPLSGVERWTWAIYPAGLALLPLAHFFVAWWGWSQAGYPPLAGSWPGVAALLLVGLMFTRTRNVTRQALPVVTFLREFFSMGWFYGLLWGVYHLLRRGISSINLILEGEGGFLWTLLLLTLLLSLLMQPGLGG